MIKNPISLQQHITQINEATGAYLVTDKAHWDSYGIYTPEEFDMYLLRSEYYDNYKYTHGFKTNWATVCTMSKAELVMGIERLHCLYVDMKEQEEFLKQAKLEEDALNAVRLAARFGVDTVTIIRWGVI